MKWSIAVLAALTLAACGRSEERGGPEAAPDTGAVQQQEEQPGMVPGTAEPEEGAQQPTAFPDEELQGDEPGVDVRSGEPDAGMREDAPEATTPEQEEELPREGGQEPTGDIGAGGDGG